MLAVEDLQTPILGPLSFVLEPGEIAVLSGPSGAGKSLLLRALADLDPHGGRVAFEGREQSDLAPQVWRRLVGLLPADCAWWGRRVGEFFPAGADGGGLETLGFDRGVLDWDIERLSSGEGQRLGLLRLLAVEPRVLLLDETTANLDAENTQRVEGLLLRYCRERRAAVLWVSHDGAQHARLEARVLRLAEGRLET